MPSFLSPRPTRPVSSSGTPVPRRAALQVLAAAAASLALPALVARLNTACNEILASAEIKKKVLDLGITTSPMSQAAFTGFVKDQVTVLAPTVKNAGVKL